MSTIEDPSSVQRVILAAENASTRLGGEAILPYHYFRLLLERGTDVHLVVHARMRDELTVLFPQHLARLHFIPDQWLQKLFYQVGRRLPHRVNEATLGLTNQLLTQQAQRAVIRALVVPGAIVHQPIPVSPRFPSLLYGVGAPVVIGPLNGGMEYPPAFEKGASWQRALLRLGRAFTNAVNALLPGKRRAAVVLAANQRTADALPAGLEGRVMLLPENAVDMLTWQAAKCEVDAHRFLFIGRLVDWKALDIVLEALQHAPDATLDVIGDGDMRAGWQALAEQLGITDRVNWLGWKTQQQCAGHLAGACALLLPSVYECGGAVVLEAMAMGRPVIATAWGGPLDYLTPECGVLIQPSSRDGMVRDFAAAMNLLMQSATLPDQMGAAGRTRVLEHFEWSRKIDAMLQVYASAVKPG